MLIDIGEHHPDGVTRVRALCRAADMLGMVGPKEKAPTVGAGVMMVPGIAEIAAWEAVSAEAQHTLGRLTREGP